MVERRGEKSWDFAQLLQPLFWAEDRGCDFSPKHSRAVAVLVVATPCPLILAAPMAFVSGPSFAARRGIVMKGVAVLERLARCMTVLIDKTGTPTVGHPQLDHALQCAALAHHDGGMTVNLATAAASKYRRSGLLVLLRGMRRTI